MNSRPLKLGKAHESDKPNIQETILIFDDGSLSPSISKPCPAQRFNLQPHLKKMFQ